MKKFLILALVLGMSSMAGAGTATLELWIASLNGVQIDPTKTITIEESDVIDIILVYTSDSGGNLIGTDVTIAVDGLATMTAPTLENGVTVHGLNSDYHWVDEQVAGKRYQVIDAGDALGVVGTTTILKEILLHCDGEDLVPVSVTCTPGDQSVEVDGDWGILPTDFVAGAPLEIIQIPEPMTLTLLGLGGLALLRRRR
jgi:hypothetical protein